MVGANRLKPTLNPKTQHIIVRLVGLALVSFVVLWLSVFRTASHDLEWWKDVGLQKHRPMQRTVPSPHATEWGYGATDHHVREQVPLHEGVHYFADYDVDAVEFKPERPISAGRHRLFSYVDPQKSRHPIRYVSIKPRLFVSPAFLSPEECDTLRLLAEPQMKRSQVAPHLTDKDKQSVSDVRTSSQTWLDLQHKSVAPIIRRVLTLLDFPEGSSEALQILRYERGQQYIAHNDYFDPTLYGKQTSNRAVTIFLYLSDVEEGGETQFPRADGKPMTYDFRSCTKGIRVRPIKGNIAVFYDMYPDGTLDDYSLHGGCPVKKGVKWGGTLWLRMPVYAPSPVHLRENPVLPDNRHTPVEVKPHGDVQANGIPFAEEARPVADDPDDKRLNDNGWARRHAAQRGPSPLIPLTPGKDYTADYDVGRVTFAPPPPIPPGRHQLFSYVDPSNSTRPVRYVSNAPRVFVTPQFLTEEECDAMIAVAEPKMKRSQVVPHLGESPAKSVSQVRTSSQTWLDTKSELMRPIVARILDLVDFPDDSPEMMQVLRYEFGQHYHAHNDYFDPELYGHQKNNRAVTIFLYLSDVEEGGETNFPMADGKSLTTDYVSCTRGIKVRPKKGTVAVFYDMFPDGTLDSSSLHGACDVKKGVKWGGTLWLRMPVYAPSPVHLRENPVLPENHDAAVEIRPRAAEEARAGHHIRLKRGVHYTADYDVDAVRFIPEEMTDAPPKFAPKFAYVDPARSTVPVRYVSMRPRIFMSPGFLSDEECDSIIAAAKPRMMRSYVVPHLGTGEKPVSQARTSSQAWLEPHSVLLRPIIKRILNLMDFKPSSMEQMQVLRYEIGQHYFAHNDYFDPTLYGPQKTNRAVTVFLYLNTVVEGGETNFPMADGKPPTTDYQSCSRGLKVKPTRGTIAVFYDMFPNTTLDLASLHGSCDVKKGVKFGGTLWLRVPVV